MARIFNIYFEHGGTEEAALVSVHANPFFTEYSLGGLTPALADALTSHTIIALRPGHLSFQGAPLHQHTPLMRKIIQAVEEHLQQVAISK